VIGDDDDLTPDDTEPEAETAEADLDAQDNSADAPKIKKRLKRIEIEQRESDEFWRQAFASPTGRREMWAILKLAGLGEPRFSSGPNGFPHPEATWFRAGAQDVAQRLLDQWQARDFEGVYVMLCEHDPRFSKAKLPPARGKA
jgi:hypothetical protein